MHTQRDERGESILELMGYLALAGVVMLVAGYFVVYAKNDRKLNAAEQAYVIAVATQRADTYIRAVATLQAEGPPAAPVAAAREAAPPPAAPPPAAPPPPPAPAIPYAPPPAAAPPQVPPTAAPPPAPRSKPPMAACIGFLVGLTSEGASACQQLVGDASIDVRIRNCLSGLIAGAGTTPAGKSDCVNAALVTPAFLSDCLLGLSDQSLFGRMACRMYYGSQ